MAHRSAEIELVKRDLPLLNLEAASPAARSASSALGVDHGNNNVPTFVQPSSSGRGHLPFASSCREQRNSHVPAEDGCSAENLGRTKYH